MSLIIRTILFCHQKPTEDTHAETGEIVDDIFGDAFATNETETEIELNLAVLKLKHKIKRKKK